MVTLSQHERDLLQTLEQCLSRAVASVDGVTPADINRTKHQKLLYLAIDEFDLPVTYSWYLAGSLVESQTVSPGNLTDVSSPDTPASPSIGESDDTEVSGVEERDTDNDPDEGADVAGDTGSEDTVMSTPDVEIERARELAEAVDDTLSEETDSDDEEGAADDSDDDADGSIQPGDHGSSQPSESPDQSPETLSWPSADIDASTEECIDFLVDQLETYPLVSTDQFLIQFYHVRAPDTYQTLYETSLHVRSTLRALTDELRAYVSGAADTVDIERHDEELGRHLTELHLELRRIDQLRSTSTAVIRATDLIEDAVMMLRQQALEELTQRHIEALETVQEFYFNWAWKYPALYISMDTATGPSADAVVNARRARLETFEDELAAERSRIKSELTDAGLVPTEGDFPDMDRTQTTNKLTTLVNSYVTRRSPDE